MGRPDLVLVPDDCGIDDTVMRMNLEETGALPPLAPSSSEGVSLSGGSASSAAFGRGICSGSGIGEPACVPGGAAIESA